LALGYRAHISTGETYHDSSRASKKQSDLLRICAFAIFGCVASVGVLACLAPMPALAQGQQGDQGQFVDTIEGSWIVHVTVDTYTPQGNGITITSDTTNGTAYGVWKEWLTQNI
jgi:hypothetical protein